MRLIDADAFLEYETKRCDGDMPYIGTCTTTNFTLVSELNKMPTIDAMPVVHGHWIWYKNHWECSVCRNNRFTNDIVLGLNAAYCSYCGAKMDGGEE